MSTEMRKVFCDTLDTLMSKDERIVIVDSDLSKPNGIFPLRQKYGSRMFNVGVAEANMTSFAAGLASYGMVPLITTFTPFASRRNCDQVAISIVYAKQNVKIVGTDPGIAAELNGGTHMSMEDVGIMRGMPGMVIVEPCDNEQMRQALPQIIKYNGPVYLRMFRKVPPEIFGTGYKFDLFSADVIKTGKDVTLFATGVEVKPALDAAAILAKEGISAEVINIHTIKPIDAETVINSVRKTGAAVTCENHNVYNGLGSAVAEVTAESYPVPVLRIGAQDRFGEVGKLDYLLKIMQMSASDIAAKAREAIVLKESRGYQ